MANEKICPRCGSSNIKKVSAIYHRYKNKESIKTFLGYDPEEYSYENILKDVGVSVAGYELKEQANVESEFNYEEFEPPEEPRLRMSDPIIMSLTLIGVFCSIGAIVGSITLGFMMTTIAIISYGMTGILFFVGLAIFQVEEYLIKKRYYSYKKAFDIWDRKWFCNDCETFCF